MSATSVATSVASSSTVSLTSTTSQLTSNQGSQGTSSTSTTLSSSPTAAIAHHGLTHRALAGIIIAAVIAAIVIIMLICLWLSLRRRRRRLAFSQPNLSSFVIIDAEGQARVAGEGVPRPTGEEEDSFLRRSGDATDGMQQADTSARLVTIPSATGTERTTGTIISPEGVVPTALRTSKETTTRSRETKTPSPFFHASHSSLFFNPSRGPDPSVVGGPSSNLKRDSASTARSSASVSPLNTRNVIPTRELMEMDNQWQSEGATANVIAARRGTTELGERADAHLETPLLPPPVLDADTSSSPGRPTSRPDSMGTMGSPPESPGSELDESATLLTARRVTVRGAGLSTNDGEHERGLSSWGSSLGLGLGGLTRLSRLSWFQRMDALRSHSPNSNEVPSRSVSPAPNLPPTRPLSGRLALNVPTRLSHFSSTSDRSSSGDTVFYDAMSTASTRSGPIHAQRPASMPPMPPRALVTNGSQPSSPRTPAERNDNESNEFILPPSIPPSLRSAHSTPPGTATVQGETTDILDTPVPPPASPFSSASSRGGPSIPPGLEHLANIRTWRESSSDMPSAASLGTGTMGLGFDVLEEEPPRPREGWANLRAVTGSTVDVSRRTTLGQVSIHNYRG